MIDWIDRALWFALGLLVAPYVLPVLAKLLPAETRLRLFIEYLRFLRWAL